MRPCSGITSYQQALVFLKDCVGSSLCKQCPLTNVNSLPTLPTTTQSPLQHGNDLAPGVP